MTLTLLVGKEWRRKKNDAINLIVSVGHTHTYAHNPGTLIVAKHQISE
jgi:hypothetical protein